MAVRTSTIEITQEERAALSSVARKASRVRHQRRLERLRKQVIAEWPDLPEEAIAKRIQLLLSSEMRVLARHARPSRRKATLREENRS